MEHRRAELQVQLVFLKQNCGELKSEMNQAIHITNELMAKYKAIQDIEELRTYQMNSIDNECSKYQQMCTNIREGSQDIVLDKDILNKEIRLLNEKLKFERKDNEEISRQSKRLTDKRRELEISLRKLKEIYNDHELNRNDLQLTNRTTLKQDENLLKDISDNNKQINLLQTKIDYLVSDIRTKKRLLDQEKSEYDNASHLIHSSETNTLQFKQEMSTKENKILLIRKEIDTIKEYIEESQSEKRKLNEKLTELVRSVEKINSNNTVISLNLNGMKESLDKKLKFLDKEKEKLENSQMSKENMLEQLRTIANLSQTII